MNTYSRKIDYLRISVTDRCNLRCLYCMPPEGIATRPCAELLTFEEIIHLTKIFSNLGISKIRLTGGEPLVRRGIVSLIENLVKIEGIEEVTLTTNATLLTHYVQELKRVGLSRINISLDTLKKEKFAMITKTDDFYNVLEGIEKAQDLGFPLKLNVVVMKGINDDEIVDFVKFALSRQLTLRFIEFMKVTPLWREDYFLPIEAVKEICRREFGIEKIGQVVTGPAEYYRFSGGIVGFIKTDEFNCKSCCRLRLTSTGELRICLYENGGIGLRQLLREGVNDRQIKNYIKSRMGIKPATTYKNWESSQVYMSDIGG